MHKASINARLGYKLVMRAMFHHLSLDSSNAIHIPDNLKIDALPLVRPYRKQPHASQHPSHLNRNHDLSRIPPYCVLQSCKT